MDTRSKILTLAQLPALPDAAIVTGFFDPLTAAHARTLARYRNHHPHLIAVVLDPPDPILPARARAELLAALSPVDYVVIAPPHLPAGTHYHEENADRTRRHELIEHVRSRHVSC